MANSTPQLGLHQKCVICVIIFALIFPFNIFSENQRRPVKPVRRPDKTAAVIAAPDSIPLPGQVELPAEVVEDRIALQGDSLTVAPVDSFAIYDATPIAALPDSITRLDDLTPRPRIFNPDPTRAVWLSALFPGLGQIYNRRYWKLPIIVAGFMGLAYGTSWNNGMLRDYSRAYTDILDNDPSTKSYMDLFPSTTKEESINKEWLTRTLKSRKDYYRRNRDLCIICMIGVYFLAMVDAYVDASLSHFDITPELSMDVVPSLIPDARATRPGLGLTWALNF